MAQVDKRPFKTKPIKVKTPKAQSYWAKLRADQIDQYGNLGIELVFSPDDPEFSELSEKIEGMLEEMKQDIILQKGDKKLTPIAQKKLEWYNPLKEFILRTKNKDGEYVEEETDLFSIKASIKKAQETGKLPLVVDGNNQPIHNKDIPNIGNESIVRAFVILSPYIAGQKIGVSVKLEALKIIQLKAYTATPVTASDFGYDDEAEFSFEKDIDSIDEEEEETYVPKRTNNKNRSNSDRNSDESASDF